MARGDRSREEGQRTSEQRERDRQERARRRAQRSAGEQATAGEAPPETSVFDPTLPSEALPEQTPEIVEQPLVGEEPDGSLEHGHAAAGPQDLPPAAGEEPDGSLERSHAAPEDQEQPGEHLAGFETPDAPFEEQRQPGEPHAGFEEPERPAGEHGQPEHPTESHAPFEAQHTALSIEDPLEPVPEQSPQSDLTREPAAWREPPAVAGEPGVGEEPAVADDQAVPLSRTTVERRVSDARTGVVAPGLPVMGRRSGRSTVARLAALVALVAAVVAVILVVKALHGENKAKLPVAPVAVRVLIPEGKTRVQIAALAAAAGLKGSYRVASRRSSLLDPTHYGAPRGTPDLEGFLFPATYDMNPGDPASRLVAKQLLAFSENFGSSDLARARALHVTPYQMLIVASMVEREAQVPGDRAKIAAVIYNRLHAGMPLGIDATIYYAVELEKGIATYTHELTESELHIDSPYNTRTHTGLPPTPISNPGVASIEAAAHPVRASYLYYVAGADGCGEQVFSTSQAAFEANAAAYQAAVSRHGGHPPVCKHR